MKLFGKLHRAWRFLAIKPFWCAIVDWCLTGSLLQLLLGHYSVRFGYQREQNYNETVLKHVFLIKLIHFAKHLIEVARKVACEKGKSCNIKVLKPAWNIVLHKFWLRIWEAVKKLRKLALLITPADKSNKQQNQIIHFFHCQPKLFHRSDLWQSTDLRWQKTRFSPVVTDLWLAVRWALPYPFGRAARLNEERFQPVGDFSNIWLSSLITGSLLKRDEVYFTTLLWQINGRQNGLRLYRECCFPSCKKFWWIKILW